MTAPGLRSVSWSQIDQFSNMCERRWWYRHHRPDIQEETTESLELGTEIHAVIEAHYERRDPPPLRFPDHVAHQSVAKLLADPRMPPLDADLRIEYPRDYDLDLTLAGVPVRGRADILWAKSSTLLHIGDHKTTKSWRYAKKADELARFGQPIIYAAFAFQRWPGLTHVEFSHNQVLTTAVGARVVVTQPLDRQHVEDHLAPLESVVERMAAVYPIEDPADVRPNYKSCNKYGRPCPYAEICPGAKSLTAGWDEDESTPTPQENPMTLKEKLAAKRRAPPTPPPTEAAAPAAVAEPVETPVVETKPKTGKKTKAAAAINPPDAAKPEPVTPYVAPEAPTETVTAPPPSGATTSTPTFTPPNGLVLFLDCQPQKGVPGVTLLEEEIHARTPALIAELRKTKPKDVPANCVDLREVEFGGGTTALVASFRRNPPKGVVVASLHARLSGEVAEALVPLADVVVRGGR